MPKFPSAERIKSRKILGEVYDTGKTIKHFPYRLKYKKVEFESGAKVQIVISIPKRSIRKAVRRNRIRRQIKEAYRLNKANLLSQFENEKEGLALFLIYTGKDDQTYQNLEKRLIELLKKLQEEL